MVQPSDVNARLDGIEDILDILSEDLAAIPNDRHILRPIRKHFVSQVSALRRAITKGRETPEYFSVRLIEFAVQSAAIHMTATSIATDLDTAAGRQLLSWATALRHTAASASRSPGPPSRSCSVFSSCPSRWKPAARNCPPSGKLKV